MRIQNISVTDFKWCWDGDYEKAKLSIGNWTISILWCEKQAIYDFTNKKLDIFNTYMHKIKNHTKEEKENNIKDCIKEFNEYINEIIKGLE